nr:hypothetical protein [uncultured Sphingomonas sp.]
MRAVSMNLNGKPRRRHGRLDAPDRVRDVVEGPGGVTRRILDGAADEADRPRIADRRRRVLRRIAEPLLEIGGNGQVRRLDNRLCVRQRLGPRHPAVALAEQGGLRPARGGERLEAERGQHARRAAVERIGDDEGA